MYVKKATQDGFDYVQDINQAKVYRDYAGALNAVGETDPKRRIIGQTPRKRYLKLPSHFDIIEVYIEEGEVIKR